MEHLEQEWTHHIEKEVHDALSTFGDWKNPTRPNDWQ